MNFRELEELGEADLSICGLRIWIHGRQFRIRPTIGMETGCASQLIACIHTRQSGFRMMRVFVLMNWGVY